MERAQRLLRQLYPGTAATRRERRRERTVAIRGYALGGGRHILRHPTIQRANSARVAVRVVQRVEHGAADHAAAAVRHRRKRTGPVRADAIM